ncbi:MAG: molecular chaperone TorD family protein [Fuerstiella sp.]|nr:molecular chaperone TorD family protein [Fuerstiella sp.]MCP4858983.1 molecular chaperone TorD family protein [Fuerstiella sp.]
MSTTAPEITFDPAVAMARQALYRFTALALLDPKFGSWERLNALRNDPVLNEAAAVLRELPEAISDELAPGERSLSELDVSAVMASLPDARDPFNQHFEKTFGLLVSNACPPYETEYIDGKFTFQRSHALADISGFYRAFGITTSESHPERPDHIVQELEFMAFLIGLTRQADCGDPRVRSDRVAVCYDAQKRFLREHLVWWVPAFTALLGREDPGGFYESVGDFLSAFITAERSMLGIPGWTQLPAPTQLEPPEACDECLRS